MTTNKAFTNFTKSMVVKSDSNVLIYGIPPLNIIEDILKDSKVNFYLADSPHGGGNDYIDSFSLWAEQNGHKLMKYTSGNFRDDLKATNRSFSLILGMPFQRTYLSDYEYDISSEEHLFSLGEGTIEDKVDELLNKEVEKEREKIENVRNNLALGLVDAAKLNPEMLLLLQNGVDEEKIRVRILDEVLKDTRKKEARIREIQNSYSRSRTDKNAVSKVSTLLTPGGYHIHITSTSMVNSEIAAPFSRRLEDIQVMKAQYFLFSEDSWKGTTHFYTGVALIGKRPFDAKKKNPETQGLRLISSISEIRSDNPYSGSEFEGEFFYKDQIEKSRELYKQVFEETGKQANSFIGYSVLSEILVEEDRVFDEIKVPPTKRDDVKVFRLGDITFEEVEESNIIQATLLKEKEEREQLASRYSSFAPTALHDGHIALLLTSGLLNSYIGKGSNQHLVKGSTYKNVETTVSGLGRDKVKKELESYNINLMILNAEGEFKTLI